MTIGELAAYLETLAPTAYQEDYDNAGLLTGAWSDEISSALISLDCTEDIVDEAIARGCGLIIAHHPIVFRGLKRLNGTTYIERTVLKAIRNNIGIYAIHTNLDNISSGVNARICDTLGIYDYRVLRPKPGTLRKLVTFCPPAQAEQVRAALFAAGAGTIGDYRDCSFTTEGFGTYTPGETTHPFAGERGKPHREPEQRIETIFPAHLQQPVVKALLSAHPYEEVAYDVFELANAHPGIGSGMIGTVDEISEHDFLQLLKEKLGTPAIRHTAFTGKPVKKVAVCGGSGSFLLRDAMKQGADVMVSADFKYHEFFDAEKKLMIADVGHFESEQFTSHLLFDLIRKKFPTFALHLTELNTNPINYFI